jgi:hypothetical protein
MSSPPRQNPNSRQAPPAPRRGRPINLNLNENNHFFRERELIEQPRIVEQKTITVTDLTGKTHEYSVDLEDDAVYNLKNDIYSKLNLDKTTKFKLIANGKVLDDYQTLQGSGLRNGSKVTMVLNMKTSLKGGKTKRKRSSKRKTRTHKRV